MLTNWPPLKLAQLAAVGLLLFCSGFLAPPLTYLIIVPRERLLSTHAHGWASLALFFLFFFPMVLGRLLAALVERRATEGAESGRWTSQEIAAAVDCLRSRKVQWTVKTFALATILFCSFFILDLRISLHSPEFRLSLSLLTLLTISSAQPAGFLKRFRQALSPDSELAPPTPWSTRFKPLRSDHWGQPKSPNPGAAQP